MNRHQVLFEQYVAELAKSKKASLAWWKRVISAESANEPAAGAEDRVRARWPMGPTSHPRVLATYRRFFIACERLNETVDAEYMRRLHDADEQGLDGWGVEGSDIQGESGDEHWGEERVIDPPTLLVDMLAGRHDELANFMLFLVFSPIGEENYRAV